jgi:hypothetical protein
VTISDDLGPNLTQVDPVCAHGTALDVHCCHCHSGFQFDPQHECPTEAAYRDQLVEQMIDTVKLMVHAKLTGAECRTKMRNLLSWWHPTSALIEGRGE